MAAGLPPSPRYVHSISALTYEKITPIPKLAVKVRSWNDTTLVNIWPFPKMILSTTFSELLNLEPSKVKQVLMCCEAFKRCLFDCCLNLTSKECIQTVEAILSRLLHAFLRVFHNIFYLALERQNQSTITSWEILYLLKTEK